MYSIISIKDFHALASEYIGYIQMENKLMAETVFAQYSKVSDKLIKKLEELSKGH